MFQFFHVYRCRCFGQNSFGQLGQGDTNARGQSAATMGDNLGPVNLGTGAVVVDMAAGSDHTCAVLDGGQVKVNVWPGVALLSVTRVLLNLPSFQHLRENETEREPRLELSVYRFQCSLGCMAE